MSNHIGNANKMVGEYNLPDTGKMVSDTPRTDDESFFPHHSRYEVCKADLARQLERELNAANAKIKRLEEAGDALYENSDPTRWDSLQAANRKLNDQEAWRKAKEEKP